MRLSGGGTFVLGCGAESLFSDLHFPVHIGRDLSWYVFVVFKVAFWPRVDDQRC